MQKVRKRAVMPLLLAMLPAPGWGFWGDGPAGSATPAAARAAPHEAGGRSMGLPDSCLPEAGGCPLLTPGTMIVGYCQSTSELFSKANAVELLNIAGKLVTEESRKHRDLAKTLTEALAESIREMFIEYGTAQAQERVHGAGARALTACTAAGAGPAMRQSEAARRGQQESAADDDRRYTMTGQSEGQVLHRLLGLAADSAAERNWRRFEYRSLFGDGVPGAGHGGTATPNPIPYTLDSLSDGHNLERARDFIQTAIAPAPLGRVSAAVARTPAGQKYEAARLLWHSEISGPQWVLNEILALHSGLIDPGGWAETAWQDLGYAGPAPTRPVSKSDYFQLMSMSRAGNNLWHNRVAAQLSEAGLLREMTIMQAVQMEMQREQLTLTEHIAGLLAMGRAAEANRTTWSTARALLSEALSQRTTGGAGGLPGQNGSGGVPYDPNGGGYEDGQQ